MLVRKQVAEVYLPEAQCRLSVGVGIFQRKKFI